MWRNSVSMQDPISDMLTRIRNAQQAKHLKVTLPSSNIKREIARVLKEEGYLQDYEEKKESNNAMTMTIDLKYFHGQPVIQRIVRISKPGLRVYVGADKLSSVPGFGIQVLSTPKGVMTQIAAKAAGIGGEILCELA